jgi:hypothetical protein
LHSRARAEFNFFFSRFDFIARSLHGAHQPVSEALLNDLDAMLRSLRAVCMRIVPCHMSFAFLFYACHSATSGLVYSLIVCIITRT